MAAAATLCRLLVFLVLPRCASALRPNCAVPRRAAICGAAAALFPQRVTFAAEPEPMVTLTPEEMAARLKRKEELLKAQGRRGKSDAKILYGAEFQMGKREVTPSSDAGTESGGSKPVGIAGFLLPDDVGGVNTQSPFGDSKER